MTPNRPPAKQCSCGSWFCGVVCRFEEPKKEPRWTDGFRWTKPYTKSTETDVSRWLDEQLIADIRRHCGVK